MTFDDVRATVFETHSRGDYQAALDAIDGYASVRHDEASDLSFWRMCLLSRLGRAEEACAELAQRLDEGFWWGARAFDDADLMNVQTNLEWQRLAAVSLDRAQEAKTFPRLPLNRSPEGTARATLVLLHGGAERPEMMIDRCDAALARGCRLVALHGTEPFASARFGWPSDDAEKVVSYQLEIAEVEAKPILVGYSQGGSLAGYLAWSHHVASAGVILVAPAMGIRGVPIPSTKFASVRTYVVVGSNDWALEDTRHAAEALSRSGVPVNLDERPGLGHNWPEGFDKTLQDGVEWILNG